MSHMKIMVGQGSISARNQHVERPVTVTNRLFIIAETTVGRGEMDGNKRKSQKRPWVCYISGGGLVAKWCPTLAAPWIVSTLGSSVWISPR